MIHPGNVAGADRMRSYYLNNLIGNPLDTTIAAACLIFGGVLERYPTLKPVSAVHGGGFIPYRRAETLGAWLACAPGAEGAPETFSGKISRPFPLYDTILHSKTSLEFLISSVGAERVFLGSDYPYDMGMMDCARHVRSLDIAEADRDTILGRHAQSLLAL